MNQLQQYFAHFSISTIELVSIVVLIMPIFVSWYFYFFIFAVVKRKIGNEENQFHQPVSIIIAARNEKNNLEENLPLWLNQNYSQFEIVIADDGSWDGTGEWLLHQTEKFPNLKYIYLDPNYLKVQGKKIALTLAIKKTQYNFFVFTDADCKPASNQWLSEICKGFTENQLCIGYSPFTSENTFLNRFVRFDNAMTAMHYLGFAIKGKTYMAVGRNMAYTKTLYHSVNGFSSHHHLPAGDDDLFVQDASYFKKQFVNLQPDSFVYTEAKKTWKKFWKQKVRHMWIGKYYKSVKRTLALFPISNLFFYCAAIITLLLPVKIIFPLGLLLIKWLPEWIIFHNRCKVLQQKKLSGMFPILQFFHTFFMFFLGIYSFFKKKPAW